jgi:uncharacterized protein (DUF1697 family)
MSELVSLFEQAGASRVVTHIQSGNVVFDATAKVATRVVSELPARIEQATGLVVPIVHRTADDFAAAISQNPFLERGADEDSLHVAFLAAVPTPAAAARLDPARSPPDTFELVGRDLHLCLPNGVGKTKLTNAYLDSKLETVSTLRNLRTVRKLVELSGRRG